MELREEIKELKERLAQLENKLEKEEELMLIGTKIRIDKNIYILAHIGTVTYAWINIETGARWTNSFECQLCNPLKTSALNNFGDDFDFEILD